jgi:hypothetical protein
VQIYVCVKEGKLRKRREFYSARKTFPCGLLAMLPAVSRPAEREREREEVSSQATPLEIQREALH